jgi:hypothetical protein
LRKLRDIEKIFINEAANLSFDLNSNSGEIEVKGLKRRKKHQIQEGKILRTSVMTSGYQVFQ